MENQKINYRIGKITGWLMISCAILYDFLEFSVDWIPVLGQGISFFIDFIAILHFSFWFILLGVNLIKPQNILRFWTPQIIELLPIPLIDFFLTTLAVFLTIKMSRIEDRLGVGIIKKPKPKLRRRS